MEATATKPMSRCRGAARGALLAGFDHDELAHHAAVLVLEDVAVEHVGEVGVGVVLE
jgi:hypothetical protein